MMGTIHAVCELGRPPQSLLQDLFEKSSTGGNEAKVRFLKKKKLSQKCLVTIGNEGDVWTYAWVEHLRLVLSMELCAFQGR